MECKSFDFSGKAVDILSAFQHEPFVFLLESSLPHDLLGRYSFIGFDPFMTFQSSEKNALEMLRKDFLKFSKGRTAVHPLSPFSSGILGYLTYDLGLLWEKISRKNLKDIAMPDCLFGFYDCVITVDHLRQELHITSSGLPETNAVLRKKRARQRIKTITEQLSALKTEPPQKRSGRNGNFVQMLKSNLNKTQYMQAVKRALQYIKEGDIYQVNLSQRYSLDITSSPTRPSAYRIYALLRELSASCFAGYWDCGDFQIISSSPERFLKGEGDQVQTRPMKGTRPRTGKTAHDKKNKRDLLKSKKDQAELLMITDLARNDLGRVCRYGSVKVEEDRVLEQYRTVFQTTSTITGKLRKDRDYFDLLKVSFPGGSITGCPKIRSMQIIEELEPTARGIYTGTLGYMSFDRQQMDFNILIRTLLYHKNKIHFQVGGGIVADSVPEKEYEETLVKAGAMRECLTRTL